MINGPPIAVRVLVPLYSHSVPPTDGEIPVSQIRDSLSDAHQLNHTRRGQIQCTRKSSNDKWESGSWPDQNVARGELYMVLTDHVPGLGTQENTAALEESWSQEG